MLTDRACWLTCSMMESAETGGLLPFRAANGGSVARAAELLEPVVVAADECEFLGATPTLELVLAAASVGKGGKGLHTEHVRWRIKQGGPTGLPGQVVSDSLFEVGGGPDVDNARA